MTPGAVREARRAQRRREGKIVLPIVIHEVEVEAMLERAGLLQPAADHTRDEIAAALELQIELLTEWPA